jgi:hypothetical protein
MRIMRKIAIKEKTMTRRLKMRSNLKGKRSWMSGARTALARTMTSPTRTIFRYFIYFIELGW